MNKRKQIIEVTAYNPNWVDEYTKEAIILQSIFTKNFIAIHHIGSTSVPGLSAKPTIDIMMVVREIEEVYKFNNQMAEEGYEAWGEYGIVGRRFFVKGDTKRTHHVHIFQLNSIEIQRHLDFRDYLIAHPKEAKEYGDLKIKLANLYSNDRKSYFQNKQSYVKELEKKAILWATRGARSSSHQ